MSSPKDSKEVLSRLKSLEKRLTDFEEDRKNLVISYLTLRTIIGILGMSLPFVVSLGALIVFRTGLQSSISAYYYTGMRDVMVGFLWVIGFFLLSYRGYERIDNLAGNLACLFAVGVAIFPTSPDGATDPGLLLVGVVHFIFAALFFLTLIFFCFVLFTKTDPKFKPTKRKLLRNRVYRLCGGMMLLCLILMAVFILLPPDIAAHLAFVRPIYWLEALAILAFGVSWFTKGEAILKDET